MYYTRKLKYEFGIGGLWPVLVILAMFALAVIFYGIKAGLLVMFISFASYSCFSIISYLRTRNVSFLAGSIYQAFMSLFFLTVPNGPFPSGGNSSSLFLFGGIICAVWLLVLSAQKKTKWKGSEMFELAARPVEESANGFTDRPRPAGTAEYTRTQLLDFTEFVKRNLIAVPFLEEDRVVFTIVRMGDELAYLLNPSYSYENRTWVAFDFNGRVSVNISKKDYLQYKDELSFDHLCDSLGKVFLEFLEYSKKGEHERILYKLKSLKISNFV